MLEADSNNESAREISVCYGEYNEDVRHPLGSSYSQKLRTQPVFVPIMHVCLVLSLFVVNSTIRLNQHAIGW